MWERTKVLIHGAPDEMEERRRRWGAVVVDGKPFGEHYTAEPFFEEAAQLAIILVSCSADSDVKELRRLPERRDTNTPDYEADLNDGRAVRIEVTQFSDQESMNYLNYWDAVFNAIRERRAVDTELDAKLRGLHLAFDFTQAAPTYEATGKAVEEMVLLLCSLASDIEVGSSYEVPPDSQGLHRCGAVYTLRARDNDSGTVRFRVPVWLSNADRILQSVPRVLNKKIRKHRGYSDDGSVAVWLAAFARDEVAGFGVTAIQELAENVQDILVEPFDRLMVANSVAGLSVDADRSVLAIYRSITVPYRAIARD